MAGLYWDMVRSNLRFIKNHAMINVAKVVYVSLYFNFVGIFLAYSFHTGFAFLTWKNAMLIALLMALGCVGYIFLQRESLKERRKEIFVRKWYGGNSGDIFMLLVTEHLFIIFLSLLISVASVDFVVLFAHRVAHILPSISQYGQNYYYQLAMLMVVVFFVTCTTVNLLKVSKVELSDVIVKNS